MVKEKTITVNSSDLYKNTYQVPIDQLEWRPSACAIVINSSSILLVKERGAYHLPGGGIEIGEQPEAAAIREVKEETGLKVSNPRLIESNSGYFTWKDYLHGDKLYHYHVIMLYFQCDFVSGEINYKHQDVYEATGMTAEWVSLKILDDIKIGTTIDWRPVVKNFLSTQ